MKTVDFTQHLLSIQTELFRAHPINQGENSLIL